MEQRSEDVYSLVAHWTELPPEAESRLIELIYAEMRRVAAALLRGERPSHLLQPAALVNETYLRLVGSRYEVSFRDRARFFSILAKVMRRILVDNASARANKPRQLATNMPLAAEHSGLAIAEILELDRALSLLHESDARLALVVEMKYFGGMAEEDIAEVLGVSSRTVKRDWSLARAWLRQHMPGRVDA